MQKHLFMMALFLAGCASPALQTQALRREKPQVPVEMEVADVPFVNQTAGYCGPATLTMVMKWAGRSVNIEELAPLVYTPGMKGSLQTDMISAARREGMLAIPIHDFPNLLKEIAAGHPVIVFENLALTWFPQWHYAVVFGYDLQHETVTMHSGPEAFKHWDMSRFERSWMLGDYWGLVVLPPGQLSASASEHDQVSAAAALEQAGKSEPAKISYQSILKRWPESLVALIGLGNIEYQEKNFSQSVAYLQRAVKAHPESKAAENNLQAALEAQKMNEQKSGNK